MTLMVNTGRDWKPGADRASAQRIPLEAPAPSVDGAGVWRLEQDGEQLGCLTQQAMAALQGFPPDHFVGGDRAARRGQIGNAIPPLLARAVLAVAHAGVSDA